MRNISFQYIHKTIILQGYLHGTWSTVTNTFTWSTYMMKLHAVSLVPTSHETLAGCLSLTSSHTLVVILFCEALAGRVLSKQSSHSFYLSNLGPFSAV